MFPIDTLWMWLKQEAIDELDRGEGIPHEQVMKEMKKKYDLR